MYLKKGIRNKFIIILFAVIIGLALYVYNNGGIDSTLAMLNVTKIIDPNTEIGNKDNTAIVLLKSKVKNPNFPGTTFELDWFINTSMTDEKWEQLISNSNFRYGANKNDAIKAMKGFTKINKEYYESVLKNKKYKYKKELELIGY